MMECKRRAAKGRKAQVTFFISVGVVIVVMVGFMVYISNYMVKRESDAKAKVSVKSGVREDRLYSYIQQCLHATAEEGIYLIGRHGGVIFTEDNGMAQKTALEGAKAVVDVPNEFIGEPGPLCVGDGYCNKTCIPADPDCVDADCAEDGKCVVGCDPVDTDCGSTAVLYSIVEPSLASVSQFDGCVNGVIDPDCVGITCESGDGCMINCPSLDDDCGGGGTICDDDGICGHVCNADPDCRGASCAAGDSCMAGCVPPDRDCIGLGCESDHMCALGCQSEADRDCGQTKYHYYYDEPYYPYYNYDVDEEGYTENLAYFGRVMLPELSGAGHSVKLDSGKTVEIGSIYAQLEGYIEKTLGGSGSCLKDKEYFEQLGYSVSESTPVVTISPKEGEVLIELDYTFRAVYYKNEEVVEHDSFSTALDMPLDKIHEELENAFYSDNTVKDYNSIENEGDIGSVKFNLAKKDFNLDGDDLYYAEAESSKIANRPFRFYVAVQNRRPAIVYEEGDDSPDDLSAVDPDGDDVLPLTQEAVPGPVGCSYSEGAVCKISATDGKLSDYAVMEGTAAADEWELVERVIS